MRIIITPLGDETVGAPPARTSEAEFVMDLADGGSDWGRRVCQLPNSKHSTATAGGTPEKLPQKPPRESEGRAKDWPRSHLASHARRRADARRHMMRNVKFEADRAVT